MHTITIRNVPDDIYQALESLAKLHHQSVPKQVAAMLGEATKEMRPQAPPMTGAEIVKVFADFGREWGIVDVKVPRRRLGKLRGAK